MKDHHWKSAVAIVTATALSVAVTITSVNGKGQKKTHAQIKRERRSVEQIYQSLGPIHFHNAY